VQRLAADGQSHGQIARGGLLASAQLYGGSPGLTKKPKLLGKKRHPLPAARTYTLAIGRHDRIEQ
jgi:hypothetical protein